MCAETVTRCDDFVPILIRNCDNRRKSGATWPPWVTLTVVTLDARDPLSRKLGSEPIIIDPPPVTPLTRWAPLCPLDHPQRLALAIAYRVKGPDLLQLRVLMRRTEGACSVVVQESPELVLVRVIVCSPDGNFDDGSELLDCPVKAYLDAPLDDRMVIEIETARRLPLYLPDWS
jgi:hypothetical protein